MATRPKVTDWLDDDVNKTLLAGWARDGLTNEQLADNMDIDISTFYRWKADNKEFREVLKVNKDYADTQMENALYKAGLEGNVTAAIFWLKNRRRNSWRDKQELEVSGELGIADVIKKSRERVERMENEP